MWRVAFGRIGKLKALTCCGPAIPTMLARPGAHKQAPDLSANNGIGNAYRCDFPLASPIGNNVK